MYAIVEIVGQQLKVENGQELFVNRLPGSAGDAVKFDKVLLVNNSGTVRVGTPSLSGVTVNGTIVEHVKGDKVIVFKKKRRKGFKVKNGHRQALTKIKIDSVV